MKPIVGFLLLVSALSVQRQVYYADAIIPQLPVGGGWNATIVLMNLSNKSVAFQVNFWPSVGISEDATPVGRRIMIQGKGMVESVVDTIPANGSYTLRTDGSEDRDPNGWAEVNSEEVLGGYVTLRFIKPGFEPSCKPGFGFPDQVTSVPFSSRFASRFLVPFDNRYSDNECSASAVALVNPSFQRAADVTVTYRDSSGQEICKRSRTLKRGEQQAFYVSDDCSLDGRTGVAEFVTSNLELSGFALRFGAMDSFVSFPAQSPIGR